MSTPLPQGVSAGEWVVDPAHTEAGFSVRHMGLSRVRGTFNEVSGAVTIGETIEESSVVAEVQAASVHTRNEGRDEHLRSADFFDVEKFPVWTFKSTALRPDGEEFEMDGDLTIHGVTQPATLSGEFFGVTVNPYGVSALGLSAVTEINRKDFGLTWNVALEAGGMMVSDKVKIELDVQLNPKS
ncbi:MAG TPA: YceI family protein [Actinomycetales bacterium]|nr:YceI family protein [Actinomycetales bacterium]